MKSEVVGSEGVKGLRRGDCELRNWIFAAAFSSRVLKPKLIRDTKTG